MLRVWMITVAMVIILVTPEAETAKSISCKTVVTSLTPCINYLTEGGDLPKDCCSGIKSLDSDCTTTAERQEACNCLKAAAKAYSVNTKYAAGLPGKCDVNIGYPISYSTNCSKVK